MTRFNAFGNVSREKSNIPPAIKTVRVDENINRVKDHFQQNPKGSMRDAAKELGLSVRTIGRILHKDLAMFPYKIQLVQLLPANSKERRLAFANNMLAHFESNELAPTDIIFSDECHFWLNGFVNKQNYRHWETENPRLTEVNPLHPLKLTVWCGVSSEKIFGPLFFTETVNSDRYCEMLSNGFYPELDAAMVDTSCMWFMQDGVRPHRTQQVFDVLNQRFANLAQLKTAIINAIDQIDTENVLPRVFREFEARLMHIVEADGGYWENLIH